MLLAFESNDKLLIEFNFFLLEEYKFLSETVKSGVIKLNSTTLAGKASNTLNEMEEEERMDHMEKNNLLYNDSNFDEKKGYWVQYNENNSSDESDDENDSFYLNGLSKDLSYQGMVISDLLITTLGTFNTVLIEGGLTSKKVISTTEKSNGYCTSYLTVYTDGYFESRFIDYSKYGRLCIIDDTLIIDYF